ncbi:MAG: hypothetical protein LBR34_10560 [Prevotella sp.]|nr:hypothetical protein [Prevotella sp.]
MKNPLTLKIIESIPPQIKPISYLMDVLDIGRESAYRRIRGDIPFTFEEITNLSLKLGFSIDEVINNGQVNRAFLDIPARSSNPDEVFLQILRNYYKYIDVAKKTDKIVIMASQNRMPLSILMSSLPLFKFYYYKCRHQTNNIPSNFYFSDMEVPQEALAIRQKYLVKLQNINNFIFVISKDVFLEISREIQYFYNRKLLSEEDVLLLKEALLGLLDKMRDIIHSGFDDYGVEYYFYLSLLDIESNSACFVTENSMISLFWIYSTNFIEVRNREICDMHKEWFNSTKKYTSLITKSNEILQTKFIERQRRFINEISNDFLFIDL